MRLNWTADWDETGIALGYSTHQKMLKAALLRAGTELTPEAKIAVHLVTPPSYQPIPGAVNVLYTMYEMQTIPTRWIAPVNNCDLLVVPCSHNKALFERYIERGVGKLPEVVVVTEGVDVDAYPFKAREFPEDVPFRFLWVGASNVRKGYVQTIQAWRMWSAVHPELRGKTELYMKTTQTFTHDRIIGFKDGKAITRPMPKQRVFKSDGGGIAPAIVDTRKLPFVRDDEDGKRRAYPASMRALYADAHAFLFPTMGEGFGLTLAEAMATGLPVIYTPWSGPEDFCDDSTGYKLMFGWTKVKTIKLDGGGTEHESWAANPSIESIVARMEEVYFGYTRALAKGRAAAARIREGFTWDISAQKLLRVLQDRFPTETEAEVQRNASTVS